MGCYIFSILFLILTVESASSTDNGFFISAPRVFHVGVNEKVFVQMGKSHLNNPVTLYLRHEISQTVVSARKTTQCAVEGEIKIVELMIDRNLMSTVTSNYKRPTLALMAESPSFSGKKITHVLVSQHRGYIFIQTDQPIYNPTQKVRYRIFTLDHTFRPHEEVIHISVINAAGNRVMKSLRTAKGGILQDSFSIPDVSKMGTWKVTAHYEDDKANAASREFKVQKFVLPSFEVNIQMKPSYILSNAEQLDFTILAKYSHGEKVKGAYHCQFGFVEKGPTPGQKMKPAFIRGLELTGSVKNGTATASLQIADLHEHLHKQSKTLSELQQSGAQLYLRVFVTNIQSGEIQEAEVYLPIISHKYTLDFSRTRSYFLPGYPLDVVVAVHLPDGSPAAGVPVKIDVSPFSEESWQGNTDQEGAVNPVFNIANGAPITVTVLADGLQQSKVIQPASSPRGSYLYISLTNKMYSVGESLTVNYNTINGPTSGFIYYMVLSRGIIIQKGSLGFGTSVRHNLQITPDMVPSFRLIGYYYNQHGDIIADSVWVDVRDECEIKVKVEQKGPFEPGKQSTLEFDLHGQKARVALLAVDKAIYALNADNKLTAKQVFSSMQSYDLGCSYSGGSDPASVLTEAGLSFVSQSQSVWKKSFGCNVQSVRQRRSVDLQQEMMTLKSNFSNEKLQDCCVQGFSLIPMRRTCLERAKRVSLVEANPVCTDAFLKCCLEGEYLRQKKIQEDARKGLGRTASTEDIEEFFLDTARQYIRRFFPPSFAFTEFDVDRKGRYVLTLPDSITTWEIQVVTLSAATGFCVVKPSEVRAFKRAFVSLRLPYSVKKYEQLSISPVIYNYGDVELQVAVHMEQTEGLCSPGSATTAAFVNITVKPESSQFVSFSAVPMVTGSIPIKIRLFDMENEMGIDAVEKTLNVLTEGLEKRVEHTLVLKFNERTTKNIIIDGSLPDDTVPGSSSNIFVSVEGDGFGSSHAKNLLSPEKVASLIVLPRGCLEQTTVRLAPTASALRYLDLTEQWFDLPAGTRDDTLDKIKQGYVRILDFKNEVDGSYRPWRTALSSNWVTALIVKVLSLVAQRQTMTFEKKEWNAWVVPEDEIRHSVRYLLSVQNSDGSFSDPHRVLRRRVLKGKDQEASMTAFITLALYRSLQFLDTELKNNVEARISRSTSYLLSHLEELQHPYTVAITAYCLAVCLPKGTDHSSVWTKLKALATEGENGCYLWTVDASPQNQANADAMTVETTAYALLATVELGETEWADRTACWLITQENYAGGFKSTQDTVVALEALAEYELKRSVSPEANLIAEFTVQGKTDIVKLALRNKEKVETDLKKFSGNNIDVQLTGEGNSKLKIVKSYYLLDPKDNCDKVSISVTVEGKVKYTAKVIENYEYYDDYGNNEEVAEKEVRMPRSAIEWFDARTRNRRDLDNNLNSDEAVTYKICVSHSLGSNLTGMAIADITLLSGFEAETKDLDRLKEQPERYISHYEVSYGRVLLYFNELFESEECISFDAKQNIPIGLLQPAPAVFYDYYEPNRKCTVFYSAPQRSKMVSTLCSEDVCQCAERPCHKIQNTFQGGIRRGGKEDPRLQHACFFPTVDYAYIGEVLNVSMKSNFELYEINVNEVLRSHGDIFLNENSVRVFAKRRQCKGHLDLGRQYLIMGKDGSTTNSNGMMQYLLESNTWVERKPSEKECKKSAHTAACKAFNVFTDEYKIDGCTQ
ncbi:complement C4-B [Sander lucioperca]|uniref:Complement C4B (Chido/Rodgers blood group) n=1 Tax=Sander lucioperca TaxID=283035 RepID=A0A8D0CMF4_SANLU|nr:complement C4-B [Sander lucioperca]